jgi:hypothetical protein
MFGSRFVSVITFLPSLWFWHCQGWGKGWALHSSVAVYFYYDDLLPSLILLNWVTSDWEGGRVGCITQCSSGSVTLHWAEVNACHFKLHVTYTTHCHTLQLRVITCFFWSLPPLLYSLRLAKDLYNFSFQIQVALLKKVFLSAGNGSILISVKGHCRVL